MIIKSDILTYDDFKEALPETCKLFVFEPIKTRMRSCAWKVRISGSSKYAPRRMPGIKTATYEEWGEFLSVLYDKDSEMVCSSQYFNADDFHKKTEYKFVGAAE